MRTVWALSLIGCFVLTANSQDSRPLNERIPKANGNVYKTIQEGIDWKNPYLVVHRNGIEVVGVTPRGGTIPVESIPDVLERLPNSAWPLGLVAAIQEAGIRGTEDGPFIKRNWKRLLSLLGKLDITVEPWPSA
jgi:hypothetical protein